MTLLAGGDEAYFSAGRAAHCADRATAGELSPFPGDPVDRILTATAVELGVPILTKDTRIRSHARGSSLRAVW